jgi:hypothetical protein
LRSERERAVADAAHSIAAGGGAVVVGNERRGKARQVLDIPVGQAGDEAQIGLVGKHVSRGPEAVARPCDAIGVVQVNLDCVVREILDLFGDQSPLNLVVQVDAAVSEGQRGAAIPTTIVGPAGDDGITDSTRGEYLANQVAGLPDHRVWYGHRKIPCR